MAKSTHSRFSDLKKGQRERRRRDNSMSRQMSTKGNSAEDTRRQELHLSNVLRGTNEYADEPNTASEGTSSFSREG